MDEKIIPKIEKPFLRGRFHEAAAFLSLGACLMLLDLCKSSSQFFATLLYSLSLVGLFTCSAIYHRIQWQEKARGIMRRLDHAAIFLLIAGTVTPLFLLTLPSESLPMAFALIWGVALLGIFQTIFWISAPKWFAAILYVGAGWVGTPYLSQMSAKLGQKGIVLLFAGGIIYTLGAVIYALKRPNPAPKIFGYHEIFHLFVAIAAVCHFLLIKMLLQA